jgi:hypothetical protein
VVTSSSLIGTLELCCEPHVRLHEGLWISRPVAGVLGAESAVLGVYVRLKREERSEELETRYRVRHARAESCDYDVTTVEHERCRLALEKKPLPCAKLQTTNMNVRALAQKMQPE